MKEVYLDNSATTRPLEGVIRSINDVLTENYGNPSSLHNKGLEAEKVMKEARRSIADKLGIKPAEIYFTSGGTESNNLAIQGSAHAFKNRGRHLITTRVEHASVLETFTYLEEEGYEVTYLDTDRYGRVSPAELEKSIRPDTILVSVIHVNNELGSINPIQELGPLIKNINHKTLFHIDAVQSFGKILVNPADWKVDLLTVSAHKVHGPKGTGALYVREGVNIKPLLYGGGQENGIRSGTENLPGIAGFIPAVKSLPDFSPAEPVLKEVDRLKHHFLTGLEAKLPEAVLNTPTDGAPHIINLSFPGIKGEVLVHSLEAVGIYISTGSACHSRGREKSHVLRAIQLSPEKVEGTVRVSLSRFNTVEELDYTLDQMAKQLDLFF